MIKGFPIDFVRATFEQTLLAEHLNNPNFYGGSNQVRIFSLYEQLLKGEDVDRYIENFKDLAEQQNRSGLILNGVITAPVNPTITNLYSCTIIPLEYVCSLRCTIENRDGALETINNLIEELKGSKVDIAELKCPTEQGGYAYVPFVVGTIGHNEGAPKVSNGDFIGSITSANDIVDKIYALENELVGVSEDLSWLYCEHENKIKVVSYVEEKGNDITYSLGSPSASGDKVSIGIELDGVYAEREIYSIEGHLYIYGDENVHKFLTNGKLMNARVENNKTVGTVVFQLEKDIEDYVDNYSGFDLEEVTAYEKDYNCAFIENDGTYPNIVFPPEHVSFKKYKMSLSFEAIRCDEPYNLNADEYVKISFGGSATIQDAPIRFGNDLVKVAISKYGITTSGTPITFNTPTLYWLEPLEMPSGNNPNIRINQLVSNNFKNNTQTDSISVVLQYSFVLSDDIHLLEQWFDYGRYGEINVNSSSEVQTMSPNLIYNVYEIWSYWGKVVVKKKKTRIADSTDIDTTEGDTMTVSVTMQVQGDND